MLRRLMRRAARHGKLLNVNEAFLWKIVDTVVHENECQYPELREKENYIISVIRHEEENFNRTIDAGMAIFKDLLEDHKKKNESVFSGADAFKLYDTFGFPLDLTIEMCADEGMTVDEAGFHTLMEEQRVRAREARKALGDLGWAGIEFGKEIPDTQFVGYEADQAAGKILAIVSEGEQASDLYDGDDGILVLDKTVLYAEMGGQEADHGFITCGDAVFTVTNVIRNKGGKYMHYGHLFGGTLKLGDPVVSAYDKQRRAAIARAHSATHMLQSALRAVLGDHVHQAGSLVQEDSLRFDFTNMSAVSKEDLRKIEDLVNGYILSGVDVTTDVMSLEDAKKSGATALFGEKYGSTVRVVKMGGFSAELCGGTHLANTAQVGAFHIVSEASVASGVRRVEALTGKKTVALLQENTELLSTVSAMFKAAPADLPERLNAQASEIRELKRQIEQFKAKESSGNAQLYLDKAKTVGSLHVTTVKLADTDAAALRSLGDVLRDKDSDVVALLASVNGEKISYLCVCGADAVSAGIKAGDVIRHVTAITNGKGGGKPDSAMGGGTDLSKLDESLAALEAFVSSKLN